MDGGLRVARPGDLDSLEWSPRPRPAPGPGEVEIEVAAAGLNFIDVLLALDAYPDRAETSPALGLDGSGTVTRTGAGVEGLRPGDRVAFLHEGSLAGHVCAPAELVFPVPAAMTPVEAATLPVAYLTAWYALVRLARLRAGETALIHSATGGVGLAALNVARLRGARVLASTGTEAKRQHLARLGVEHVLDSRSLAFAAQARAITGDGVDVVLNSLTGPAQLAGLELLRPQGRFVEIGKRDIHGGGTLPLAPFRHNLSLHSVDLLLLARTDRPLLRELLAELAPHFAQRRLEPLPHQVFPLTQAAAAFRSLTTGRHIGKVVLTLG